MELIILDDTYQEQSRFTNFESLVWNERYQTPGDFQLTSYGIQETYGTLPHNTLVGVDKSDYVMIVTSIESNVDPQGNEVVTVTGKTLEWIFGFRPAVPKISSVLSMEFENPDGWTWGDKYENEPYINPYAVMIQVVDAVDQKHYYRDDLKFLELPFSYYSYTHEVGPEDEVMLSEVNNMTHYAIDRGSTVLDVFDELLPRAEMGVATLRPNANSKLAEDHLRNEYRISSDRHAMFVYYRPRMIQGEGMISFDHAMEDYTSENVTEENNFPNSIAVATEDRVLFLGSAGFGGHGGLKSRFKLRERELQEASEFDRRDRNIKLEAGFSTFDELTQSRSFSLETSGVFPYSKKKYRFGDSGPDSYFLGDAIALNLLSGSAHVQITEYIRTMDANGYREYPVFQLLRKIGNAYNNTILLHLNNAVWKDWN